ncbi:MAG: hypothetical protein EOP53_15015, partial [Sphingobacteriales bacterium]
MKHFFIKAYMVMAGILAANHVFAQETGQLSGEFQTNFAAYDTDSIIGTTTTQYFHEKSSAEAWLVLNYRIKDFTLQTRFDLYNNSPLLNTSEAYTRQGIGFYSISKKISNFDITVGHFYDQFGSGIVFRAFEDRTIGLDYAIQGVRVQYNPTDSFMIKAFTGLQKNRLDVRNQVVKGLNAEQIWHIGKVDFLTGGAFLNRTLDQSTMVALADQINSLPLEERFIPKYNVYAGSIYNTLRFKNISIYTEYAKKSKEAVILTDAKSGISTLTNTGGDVIYGSLSYSVSGFGVNLQYKKVDNFILRSSPYNTFLEGALSYLPALSKQHSFRLPARYSISALAQGEEGAQAEITYSYNKNSTFNFNTSQIFDPNGNRLFREYYIDYNKKFNKKVHGIFGFHTVFYDQEVYEFHPDVKPVQTITPFVELSIRLDGSQQISDPNAPKPKKKNLRPSIRTELQYLQTEQDKGDFAFGLLELNLAPKYSFSVSDMVNTKPKEGEKPIHYYSFFASYTEKQTRFTAGYAKQVAGVVCTGGVCR